MTDDSASMPATSAPSGEIDARTFWGVLGQRAIGSTVVTAQGAEGPAGFLGLSAAHVSASPPRVLISADTRTSALRTILDSGSFAINILRQDGSDIAAAFGGRAGISGAERFAGHRWGTLATGAPVLDDALGVFDCRVEETLERDGVVIVIGRVVAARAAAEGAPLIHFRGGFLP